MTTQRLTDLEGKHVPLPHALRGFPIKEGFDLPPPHKLRMYVKGMPNMGKTFFGASIPGAIIVDTEDMVRLVPHKDSTYFIPDTGDQLEEFVAKLCEMGASDSNPVKHVVFDTVEKLVWLVIPYLTDKLNARIKNHVDDIREFGEKGAGWGKVNDYVTGIFRRLYAAGYGWTVLGHNKEEFRWNPGSKQREVVYRSMVNPGIAAGLYQDAQYVGVVRVENRKVSVPVKLKSGAETAKLVSEQRYVLDLTNLESGNMLTQVVKSKLGDKLPRTFDITGLKGWSVFAEAYSAAKAAVEAPST